MQWFAHSTELILYLPQQTMLEGDGLEHAPSIPLSEEILELLQNIPGGPQSPYIQIC